MVRNVIIIGSGPAGLTAGLYTGRANLQPLMIEGFAAGGQLMLTTEVENYPGFPKGLLGPELIAEMRKQALRFGTEILTADVTRVDFSARPFRAWVDKDLYEGKAVIVATGADAKWLGLPNEQRLRGHGVSSCATCDGFFFQDQEIMVVGGGDTAMEETLFLTKFGRRVTVVHRRDKLRASKIMQEKALKHPKVRFIWNAVVEDVLGDDHVTGVRLKELPTGRAWDEPVGGLFIGIGHSPNTRLFRGQLEMDDNGYIVTHHETRTSVEGVFAAGDVQDHVYRQAITAAGSGCMAAIDAERWLEGIG
ncbi:MAG TPA: thioredoxin-disulfide reductase [Candidatus Sulfotelmatobacter sp.]|nr:thioredoxin-disulfide reductase [Candidatus Sulfotelmatobacter sp.]